MKELKIDERFEKAAFQLPSLAFGQLADLIIKDGIIYNPILIWNDVIIDGHRRYFIAKREQIPFTTKEINFESDDEAILWIKENAVSQRNLNDYQKVELLKDIEQLSKEIGRKKMSRSVQMDKPFSTREELQKKSGLSSGTIARAKVIDKKASEEIKEKLRKGETTIGKVYNELRSQEQGQINSLGAIRVIAENYKREQDPDVKKLEECITLVKRVEMHFDSEPLVKEFQCFLIDLIDLMQGKLIMYQTGLKDQYPGIKKTPLSTVKDKITTDIEFEELGEKTTSQDAIGLMIYKEAIV